jgi:hypothetical protein
MMSPHRRPRRYILIDHPTPNSGATPLIPEIPADPIEFARMLGFELDPYQRAILESRAKRGIVNGSRQCGKSTLLALMAVHRALTDPKCLVLLLGPFNRQAGELLEKAKDFIEQLGLKAPGDGRHRNSIRLPNRSRIIAVPAVRDRVRGFSAVRLLIIDEAAFVKDDTYKTVRPMLAVSEGDLWLISTPLGRRGFFYKIWTEGGDEWRKFKITAADCPRIPSKYLEEEREVMTESEYLQEFFCTFVDPSQAVFRMEVLLRAIDPNVFALEL